MKYLFIALCTLFSFTIAMAQLQQGRLLDQPVGVATANIKIDAGFFTTKTFIELEFCNPNRLEMEGLYRFRLEPGQVITGFQLELNGRYRDGSIEEKSKATNAYNSIVGKRIDPAILSMEYQDNYRINVYPIPAGGCRKVSITIEQANVPKEKTIKYALPLVSIDTVKRLYVFAATPATSGTARVAGQLSHATFSLGDGKNELNYSAKKVLWNKPIEFTYQMPSGNIICTEFQKSSKKFQLFSGSSIPAAVQTPAKNIVVYWDASASLRDRDVSKEIEFLQQVLAYHSANKLTIVRFNYRVLDSNTFSAPNKSFAWQQYLAATNYSGATQLGAIDLSKVNADMVLIFSDGINTYGKSRPNTGTAKVFCITTSQNANIQNLSNIAGQSGGSLISLLNKKPFDNLKITSDTKLWLMSAKSANGSLVLAKGLPALVENGVSVSGKADAAADTLVLEYGTNSGIIYTEIVGFERTCHEPSLSRYDLLLAFAEKRTPHEWQDVYELGIREKVVTQYTSFLVLERIEDYIRYNIAPPKELEEECAQKGFVKQYHFYKKNNAGFSNPAQTLNNVAMIYRQRMGLPYKPIMRKDALQSDENTVVEVKEKSASQSTIGWATADKKVGFNAPSQMEEVVVTSAYQTKRAARSVTYSTQIVRGKQLTVARESNINNALAGKVAGLQVRSQAAANLGRETPIRLRGENGLGAGSGPVYVVDGTITNSANDINTDDIEDVTILQGPAATALFGPEGANGAIVINMKRGKRAYNPMRYENYKLKDMDEMDYLLSLKQVSKKEKYALYEKLAEENGQDEAFHFDVAMHFFENGMNAEAEEVMMNAIESSGGIEQMYIAAGYMYDRWKKFDKAIFMYEQAFEKSKRPEVVRSLAWAYFNAGRQQEAIDVIFSTLSTDFEANENHMMPLKQTMLADMNAMISIAGNRVDVSAIPTQMIVKDSADYRVVVEYNFNQMQAPSIKEPNGKPGDKSYKKGVVAPGYNYWYNSTFDYKLLNVNPGKYSLTVPWSFVPSVLNAPMVLRKTEYKNFGKPNQSISTELVVLDGQYGNIEIFDWIW